MFNSLSDRLTATFKNLRGKGRLSEADIDATVREIRRALLDAYLAEQQRLKELRRQARAQRKKEAHA